jgi:hypothetical protein
MSAQLGLFTNVHRSDPVSSFEAAVVSAPVRQTHIDLVMMYVNRHPGLTASELSTLTGLDVVETRRRLTDAKNELRATQGDVRLGMGRTVRECTWWPL